MSRDGGERGRNAPVSLSGSGGWLVLRIVVPAGLCYDTASTLVELGAGGVQEQDGALVAHLPLGREAAAEAGALAEIGRTAAAAATRALMEQLPWLREPDIEWRVEADTDWTTRWKEGLGPRRVGERIWTAPSWALPDSPEPEAVVLVVDPAMAFGTGEHGTTRGCLRLLERVVSPRARVLDVGTGTGILALAAVKLGAACVLAVDNDPDAVENARETVERNGARQAVRVERATVDQDWLLEHAPGHDLIVANVLSGVLRPLLPTFAATSTSGAHLILGGILEEESAGMRAAAAAAGFAAVAEDRDDGWWSALLRRS